MPGHRRRTPIAAARDRRAIRRMELRGLSAALSLKEGYVWFMTYRVQRLLPGDIALLHGMLTMFGEAFEDELAYGKKRPSPAYLDRLLGGESFIALVAVKGSQVVGGLAAYELQKFEQERSELYIYDLAVSEQHRREGIATALINELRELARQRGAYVVYVQADHGDDPAVALYTKLGKREDVMHFDIAVSGTEEG